MSNPAEKSRIENVFVEYIKVDPVRRLSLLDSFPVKSKDQDSPWITLAKAFCSDHNRRQGSVSTNARKFYMRWRKGSQNSLQSRVRARINALVRVQAIGDAGNVADADRSRSAGTNPSAAENEKTESVVITSTASDTDTSSTVTAVTSDSEDTVVEVSPVSESSDRRVSRSSTSGIPKSAKLPIARRRTSEAEVIKDSNVTEKKTVGSKSDDTPVGRRKSSSEQSPEKRRIEDAFVAYLTVDPVLHLKQLDVAPSSVGSSAWAEIGKMIYGKRGGIRQIMKSLHMMWHRADGWLQQRVRARISLPPSTDGQQSTTNIVQEELSSAAGAVLGSKEPPILPGSVAKDDAFVTNDDAASSAAIVDSKPSEQIHVLPLTVSTAAQSAASLLAVVGIASSVDTRTVSCNVPAAAHSTVDPSPPGAVASEEGPESKTDVSEKKADDGVCEPTKEDNSTDSRRSSLDSKRRSLESQQSAGDECKAAETADRSPSFVGGKSKTLRPNRPGLDWSIGGRLEAKDFLSKWYPAKIVEIDDKDLTVLIHFDGWNQRYDEWVEMNSDRLRPASRQSDRAKKDQPKQKAEFKVSEYVYARWTDCKMYPAKIMAANDDGKYDVMFYDGLRKRMKPTQLSAMPPDIHKQYKQTGLLAEHRGGIMLPGAPSLLTGDGSRSASQSPDGTPAPKRHHSSNTSLSPSASESTSATRQPSIDEAEPTPSKLRCAEQSAHAAGAADAATPKGSVHSLRGLRRSLSVASPVAAKRRRNVASLEALTSSSNVYSEPATELEVSGKSEGQPNVEGLRVTTSGSVLAAATQQSVVTGATASSEMKSVLKKQLRLSTSHSTPRDQRRSVTVAAPRGTPAIPEEGTPSPVGSEQLRCSVCRKSFRNETLLDYHMKYFHCVKSPVGSAHRRTSLPDTQPATVSHAPPTARSRARTTSATSHISDNPQEVCVALGPKVDLVAVGFGSTMAPPADAGPVSMTMAAAVAVLPVREKCLPLRRVVNCVCQQNRDTSHLIQCTVCLCWQHTRCIQTSASDPTRKYVCYVCTDPPGVRESARYSYDQDWLREGRMAEFSCVEAEPNSAAKARIMKTTHDLVADLHGVLQVMDSVGRKIAIVNNKVAPEYELWAQNIDLLISNDSVENDTKREILKTDASTANENTEQGETSHAASAVAAPEDTAAPVSQCDSVTAAGADVGLVASGGAMSVDNGRKVESAASSSSVVDNGKAVPEATGSSAVDDLSEVSERSAVNTVAGMRDVACSVAVVDETSKLSQQPESVSDGTQPTTNALELEPKQESLNESTTEPLETTDVREKNLLRHISRMQNELDSRLAIIEEQVNALENGEGNRSASGDSLRDMPRVKKTVRQLINDLEKIMRMSRFNQQQNFPPTN